MKKILVLVMAMLLLSGCMSLTSPTNQIEGFPQDLKITVHETTLGDIQNRCGNPMPLFIRIVMLAYVAGCANVNLYTYECNVYVQKGDRSILGHELKHCKGWWHEDTQNMPAYYNDWLSWRQKYNVQDADIPRIAEEIKQIRDAKEGVSNPPPK